MSSTRLGISSNDVALFARVAQTLSFKDAADALGISRSAVSKRIARLETNLGATLVNRTSRSLSLSELGGVLSKHCTEIEAALHKAERAIRDQDPRPVGTVHFSVPTSLGAALMPSLVSDFQARYPDIRLNAHFAESFVDVVTGGYDLVIRLAQKLADSSLTAQRLMTSQKVLVASPRYLEKYGTPSHVRELKNHRCLGLGYVGQTAPTWRFSGSDGPLDLPMSYAFTANNDLALNLAACMDMGFLYTAEILVSSELARNRLRVVLPEFCQRMDYGVYVLYPHRHPPTKARVFVEFVREKLEMFHRRVDWSPLTSVLSGP